VLGMPLMDIKIVKATQMVFTSLGIIISVLGVVVIVGAGDAMTDSQFRIFWLILVSIVISLAWSGYYGVRRSNPALLGCFCHICAVLMAMFGMMSFMVMMAAGTTAPLSAMVFLFGVTGVFWLALQNAWFLREKSLSGVSLTAPSVVDQDQMPPTQIGAVVTGLPLPERAMQPESLQEDNVKADHVVNDGGHVANSEGP